MRQIWNDGKKARIQGDCVVPDEQFDIKSKCCYDEIMVSVTAKTWPEIASLLVPTLHPEKIILFGSYAKGTPHKDSDLDLLIVTGRPFENPADRRKILSRVRHILSEIRIPKDILVYTSDEVEKWKGSINHIIGHAFKEGKPIYERS